jgi:uncharacterized protein YdgA (DUF945 family)
MVVTVGAYFHTEKDFLGHHASIPQYFAFQGFFAMKRWLVVSLVLLALLVLIMPGIVGRLAEQNIADNIEWAESDSPAVNIETERFERGWFTSEGRHRVALDAGQFREISEEYRQATGNEALPSLIIDTKLAHGPLPGGSLTPGLATSVSTFSIDPGNGETIEVPGSLTSEVALSGESDSHLLLEPGAAAFEGASFEWQGADMDFVSNPATGAIAVDGEIKPWTFIADDGRMNISAISVTADQSRSAYGFRVGSAAVQTGEITLEEDGAVFSIDGIAFSADTNIRDDRLDAESTFTIKSMTVPAFGKVDFDMDFIMTGADAASIGVIGAAVQEAQGAIDPEAALANLYPQIEEELEVLFKRGFEMRLDRLDIALPQGVIATKLDINVPESVGDVPLDWSSVLLNMTGNLDLRIPGPIYEMAAIMNSQAGALVSMGLLVQDGEDYVMNAEYAQGLFNVNGAPMPIPMPQ